MSGPSPATVYCPQGQHRWGPGPSPTRQWCPIMGERRGSFDLLSRPKEEGSTRWGWSLDIEIPPQSPRTVGKVTARCFVFPKCVCVLCCLVCLFLLCSLCHALFSLTMASGLAFCFSPHRRKGCGDCAVPLSLVLLLLPACLQVIRGRLAALGGSTVLCWGQTG